MAGDEAAAVCATATGSADNARVNETRMDFMAGVERKTLGQCGPDSIRNAAASPHRDCRWVATHHGRAETFYSSPRIFRPSAEIICGVHCGSQTMCTFADSTLGSAAIFWRASSAMVGPIPQPGAVKVIFT